MQYGVDRREPLARVVGNFADDQRTWFLGVRRLGQLVQKTEADVEGDVEPPAVDAVAQPATHDRIAARVNKVAHLRVLEVQLGKVFSQRPGTRTTGVLRSEEKPVAIRAVGIGFGLLEQGRVSSHVVEHAVQHQLHAATVHCLGQPRRVCTRAEFGRDLFKVERIILVVGVGEVNRIEVQHVGAELLHIIELARHAGQVATPEFDLVAPDFGALDISTGLGQLAPPAQHFGRRVQRLLGLQVGRRREAVHQHLVDDGAIAPVFLARLKYAGQRLVGAVGIVHLCLRVRSQREHRQRCEQSRKKWLHPLTPPAVSPETIQRCAARNTSVMGRPERTAAAAKSPHRNF